LGDRRNAGENSCYSGDGTGQMAQPLMFMMMMMMKLSKYNNYSFSLLIMYGSSMFRHYIAIFRERS
jgi:hypothetical protein